jgi:hypothetical protein
MYIKKICFFRNEKKINLLNNFFTCNKMDSSSNVQSGSVQTGTQGRVMGVINKLIQYVFLKYVALFTVIFVATFLGLHYWTDIFREQDGSKNALNQGLASSAVALLACLAVFFLRLW